MDEISNRDVPKLDGAGLRAVPAVFGIALIYFVAVVAVNRFAFEDGWTILWPINGFTVGWLLRINRRDWPLVMVGVVMGTFSADCYTAPAFNLLREIVDRCLSMTEVICVASMLPRFVNLEDWLRKPNLARRVSVALVVGPVITGIPAAVMYHYTWGASYLQGFSWWALADILGLASMMPLSFALTWPETWRLFSRERLLKTSTTLLLAFAASAAVFFESRYPIVFVLYPILLLVDSMLGFAASAITVAWVCLIAVYFTTKGIGPFVMLPGGPLITTISLQIYLAFHVLILLPASTLLLERKRAERELREAHEQMKRLASIDPLTGVANRRSFDAAVDHEWGRTQRTGGSLALLMIDIDHFKEFNDSFGHQAGDACLIAVANVIAEQARRPGDVAARYGGEEFAVLLPEACPASALAIGLKVVEAVAALQLRHPRRGTVTVSVGAAAIDPVQTDHRAELMRLADRALYQAKREGRNRVCAQKDLMSQNAAA